MDKRLYNWIERRLLENNQDPQAIDVEALIDGELTYQEQKQQAQKLLEDLLNKDVEEIKQEREKYSIIKEQHAEQEERKNKEEFAETIQDFKNNTTLAEIEPIKKMKFYIKMVLEDYSKGLYIESRGGLGKSASVHMAISELGLDETDYAYITGHLTKTELYKKLYDNRDKVVILDDISTINNKGIIALLKTATWGVAGKRFVQYNSPTNTLKEYPLTFEFSGGIMLLANEFRNTTTPDNEALMSRLHKYELQVSKQELAKMLYIKAEKDRVLQPRQAKELVDEIIKREDELLGVDLRTLDKAYEIYAYAKKKNKDFREYLDTLFIASEKVEAFKKAMRENQCDVSAQVRQFSLETGYSRAEYYRLKKRYGLSRRYEMN